MRKVFENYLFYIDRRAKQSRRLFHILQTHYKVLGLSFRLLQLIFHYVQKKLGCFSFISKNWSAIIQCREFVVVRCSYVGLSRPTRITGRRIVPRKCCHLSFTVSYIKQRAQATLDSVFPAVRLQIVRRHTATSGFRW